MDKQNEETWTQQIVLICFVEWFVGSRSATEWCNGNWKSLKVWIHTFILTLLGLLIVKRSLHHFNWTKYLSIFCWMYEIQKAYFCVYLQEIGNIVEGLQELYYGVFRSSLFFFWHNITGRVNTLKLPPISQSCFNCDSLAFKDTLFLGLIISGYNLLAKFHEDIPTDISWIPDLQ